MMAASSQFKVVAVVLPVLAIAVANAQTTESEARLVDAQAVRDSMNFESSHHLRVTRREDWEDILFGLQLSIKGQIAKAAYFFEVTETGYFILSPDEAVYVSSMVSVLPDMLKTAMPAGAKLGLSTPASPAIGAPDQLNGTARAAAGKSRAKVPRMHAK